jgi:hypothetical protein
LDGSVQVFNSKGGASPVIENPLIVRHKNENVTVLAWADSTDPDHLSTVAIADEDLNQVLVYGNGPEQLPSFIETDATLNYQPPAEVPDSQTGKQSEAIEPVPLKGGPIPDNYADQGRFLNQAGTQLGYELPEIPSYTNGTYSLSVNDYSGDLDILPNVK